MQCFSQKLSVASFVLFSCAVLAQTTVNSSVQLVYRNGAFGYVIKLPPGMTYSRSTPPNPDHGFGVSLEGNVKLWVDASYADSSSTENEVNTQSGGCRVENRGLSKLGGRAALSIRFACPANAYSGTYEEMLVLTILREPGRSPVDYQIGMRANTPEDLSRNMAVFGKIVAGFRFEK